MVSAPFLMPYLVLRFRFEQSCFGDLVVVEDGPDVVGRSKRDVPQLSLPKGSHADHDFHFHADIVSFHHQPSQVPLDISTAVQQRVSRLIPVNTSCRSCSMHRKRASSSLKPFPLQGADSISVIDAWSKTQRAQ